jgi:hypothetical protein
MRLVRVELARAASRRQVKVLVLLALVGILVAGVVTLVNTESIEDAGQLESRQRAEFLGYCVPDAVRFQGMSPEVAQQFCEEQAQHLTLGDQPGFVLTDLWEVEEDGGVLAAGIVVLVLGAVVAAASFTGAEWKHGTIGTQLVWEPRRGAVLGAKLAVVAVVTFLCGIVLQALLCLALWPTALVKTTTEGADGAWLADLAGAVLRGSALAALTALAAASIAMIGRNTAAAIGAAFVYLLVVENAVRAWFDGMQRWLLAENAAAMLVGEVQIGEQLRSAGPATATLVAYVGLAMVAALVTFRARDVAGST